MAISGDGFLRDFTTDRRVLVLTLMAVAIGAAGTVTAWALLKLIGGVTNLAWFGRYDAHLVSPGGSPFGVVWRALLPAAGGLVIGLMARFGSEKIRGHGIPEAIEAILIGGSRIEPRV